MNELDVLTRFREDVPEPSPHAWLQARAAIEAARRDETSEQSRPRGNRRRIALVAAGFVFAASTATLVVALNSARSKTPVVPPRGGVATHPSPVVIRARVVDALSTRSNTILYEQSTTVVPGQPPRGGQEWDYPWNGQAGQLVHEAGSESVGGIIQGKWGLTFSVPAGASGGTSTVPLGAACNVSGQRIDVNYTNQTWQTSVQTCVALTPGLDTVAFVNPKTGQLVSNIRTLVADGFLLVVGYPTVGGQPTVELRSSTYGATTLDLWVNADTYLPMQSVSTSPTTGDNGGISTMTVQYSFLSPTQSTLDNLHVTAPHGFTQTFSSEKG
jgi:hypothetical protein